MAVLVDTNHANSNKHFKEQMNIALDVLHSRRTDSGLHTLIKGLLIESYLVEGCQPLSSSQTYGQSITDPCLAGRYGNSSISNRRTLRLISSGT